MQSGRLNKRVSIINLNEFSDGYGGTFSMSALLNSYTSRVSEDGGSMESITCVENEFNRIKPDTKKIWVEFEEVQANVDLSQGRQKQRLSVEFNVRKRTADLFDENDVLEIEGYSGQFRINGMFQSKLDQYTKINATKIV